MKINQNFNTIFNNFDAYLFIIIKSEFKIKYYLLFVFTVIGMAGVCHLNVHVQNKINKIAIFVVNFVFEMYFLFQNFIKSEIKIAAS